MTGEVVNSIYSFFSSLGSPSHSMRQISSLTKEIRKWELYLEEFDRHEFEADFVLTADIEDLTNLDAFEHDMNMRTLEHIKHIFNYLSVLSKKLEELKSTI